MSTSMSSILDTLVTQTTTLINKNIALQRRALTSTLIQTLIGVILLFFVLLLKISDNSIGDSYTYSVEVRHPTPTSVGPLLPCIPENTLSGSCYDFVYSPEDNEWATAVAEKVAEKYGLGVGGKGGGFLGLANEKEVDEWLFEVSETGGICESPCAIRDCHWSTNPNPNTKHLQITH